MKYSFNKGIAEIRKIRLTADEKREVFARITHSGLVRSPWTVYTLGVFSRRHAWMSGAAIFLIILATGGGLVSAAEGSLPGDLLYPVKVSVTEPVRDAFAKAPEAKAEWQVRKAARRMQEAETLASAGKLDQAAEDQLGDLLDDHTAVLAVSLEQVREQAKPGSEDRADDIIISFQADMNAHAQVLDTLKRHSPILAAARRIELETDRPREAVAVRARRNAGSVESSNTGVGTVAVSMQKNHPARDSVTSISADVALPMSVVSSSSASGPVDTSAASVPVPLNTEHLPVKSQVTETLEKVTEKPAEEQTSHDRKRLDVRSLINDVQASLDKVVDGISPLKRSLFDQVEDALNESVRLADESDKLMTEGDRKGSHSALLQAERSVREADVLLRAALRFNGTMDANGLLGQ